MEISKTENLLELSTNSLTWLEAVFSCTRYGVKIREELKITVDSLQTLKPGKRINKLVRDSFSVLLLIENIDIIATVDIGEFDLIP